jgi:hypothetical protein
MDTKIMLDTAKPAARTLRTHSRRLSEIETLMCRECALLDENIALATAADELSAQNLFHGHIDARLQEVNEQLDAIAELLTHQTPETVRDMRLMQQHLEELAGATNEQTCQSRLRKIVIISESVRRALPDVPFLDHERQGFMMSQKTRTLLDHVASAKSGPVLAQIAEPAAIAA